MKTQGFDGARSPLDMIRGKTNDPFPIGSVILGKYTVERSLGQGGMGVVVAARHKDLGCLHAIKVLLGEMVGNEQIVQRFLREARAAANLRGEHIARVHDVGRFEDGEPYMVMEYLDGKDLRAILKNGPLPIDVVVLYVLQICEAVAEAHAAGIVHRDLKPANLYLTVRPNRSACIKVLDFGIARMMGDNADLTKDLMIGSLKYMGPEQILKSREADFRADIWAIGAITYELLTGKAPFGGPSQVDLISAILSDEPEPPSIWRKELPPEIEAVILRCLRKNREERFQSADDLASALREAAGIVVDSQSVMRLPMPSVSIVLETPPPAQPEERTRLETAHTIPEFPHSERNWKVLAAAGAAAMTLGVVVTLVVALQRSPAESVAAAEGMLIAPGEVQNSAPGVVPKARESGVVPGPIVMGQETASAMGAENRKETLKEEKRTQAGIAVRPSAEAKVKPLASVEVVSPRKSPTAKAAASATPEPAPVGPSAPTATSFL